MRPPCGDTPASCPGGGGGGTATGICANEAPAANSAVNNRQAITSPKDGKRLLVSVSRRVVSGLRISREGRESLGGAQLDLDFPPTRVMNVIAWFVSQYILIAHLHADFRSNIR